MNTTTQTKTQPVPEDFGYCSSLDGCEFIYHSLLPADDIHHGELHIRPPAGLKIGLNVGRIVQNAYQLKQQRDDLLNALVCVVGALSGVAPISQEAMTRAKEYASAAIDKAKVAI